MQHEHSQYTLGDSYLGETPVENEVFQIGFSRKKSFLLEMKPVAWPRMDLTMFCDMPFIP